MQINAAFELPCDPDCLAAEEGGCKVDADVCDPADDNGTRDLDDNVGEKKGGMQRERESSLGQYNGKLHDFF